VLAPSLVMPGESTSETLRFLVHGLLWWRGHGAAGLASKVRPRVAPDPGDSGPVAYGSGLRVQRPGLDGAAPGRRAAETAR